MLKDMPAASSVCFAWSIGYPFAGGRMHPHSHRTPLPQTRAASGKHRDAACLARRAVRGRRRGMASAAERSSLQRSGLRVAATRKLHAGVAGALT